MAAELVDGVHRQDADQRTADHGTDVAAHAAHYAPSRAWLLPRLASSAGRVRRDLEAVRRLVRLYDDRRGIERNVLLGRISARLSAPSDALLALEERVLQRSTDAAHLDLLLWYLRRVHLHDYYAGRAFSVAERGVLDRLLWLRGTATRSGKQDEAQWERELDRRTRDWLVLLAPDADWPAARKATDALTEAFWRKHCEKEGEQRYRCSLAGCGKMFRGEQWLQKHVENKHSAELKAELKAVVDRQCLVNYLADADRLQPTAVFAPDAYTPPPPMPMPMSIPGMPMMPMLPMAMPMPMPMPMPIMPMMPPASGAASLAAYRDLDQPAATKSGAGLSDFDQALAAFADSF